MLRTISVAENDAFSDPPKIVTYVANTAIEVLPNESGTKTGEIVTRLIQNLGASPLYYAFGTTGGTDSPANPPSAVVDAAVNFHGVLPQYAQMDCSNNRLRVCAISTAGGTIATTIIRRADLTKHN